MQKIKNIAHIILAAGSSSRMETPKQLLPWENDSLISYEIKKSLKIEQLVTYVVLGANFEIIKKEIAHFPIEILYHKEWESGMGSSISYGIQHILNSINNFDGLFISLVDQPLIDVLHFQRLVSKFNTHKNMIIATGMKERIGAPAIFPYSYFKELLGLTKDYGARNIIKKYKDQIIIVSGNGKTSDIDTIEQYNVLIKRLKES